MKIETPAWNPRVPKIGLLLLSLLVFTRCSSGSEPTPGSATPAEPPACPASGCPQGQLCATTLLDGKEYATCLALCDPLGPDTCGEGRLCRPLARSPNVGICGSRCRSNADCPADFTCDVPTGLCRCGSDAACAAYLEPAGREAFVCGPERTCIQHCVDDEDCSCGNICEAGRCIGGCRGTGDCCGQALCAQGRCGPSAPGDVGDRCYFGPLDCQAGQTCLRLQFERGMCAPAHRTSCDEARCPTGTACSPVAIDGQSPTAACLPACSASQSSTCRSDARCTATVHAEEAACTSGCSADAECGTGGRCIAGRCGCASDSWCKAFGASATCAAEGACACVPDCAGRQCGADGCGGTCGSCSTGFDCSAEGRCVGSCGGSTPYVVCSDGSFCPPNSVCNGSFCNCTGGRTAQTCAGASCPAAGCAWEWKCAACVPQCSGRQCGSDGCGGSCGSCPNGSSCEDGTCVTDTSGQTCPPCASDELCVTVAGVPTCLQTCSVGGDCGSGCCVTTTSGQQVCGASSSCQTNTCTDYTGCLQTVKAVSGTIFGDPTSLSITVRNTCSHSIGVQICIRKQTGRCDCGLDDSVGPGAEMNYWALETANIAKAAARAVEDYGHGCYPDDC